jgi:four helix bundle protein
LLAVVKKERKASPLDENNPEQKKDKKRLNSFEELECWKACTEVRRFITTLVKQYPKVEQFSLVDDMKRAARSTTHNIAEGFGRFHFQENIQFCRISRGSLCELIDQLITSLDEGLITELDYEKGRELIDRALALLNGYINYLARQKDDFRSRDE